MGILEVVVNELIIRKWKDYYWPLEKLSLIRIIEGESNCACLVDFYYPFGLSGLTAMMPLYQKQIEEKFFRVKDTSNENREVSKKLSEEGGRLNQLEFESLQRKVRELEEKVQILENDRSIIMVSTTYYLFIRSIMFSGGYRMLWMKSMMLFDHYSYEETNTFEMD